MLTNALSAKAVASLKEGKHRDGQGLQFEVKGGSRRWTFSYMFEGRQRELAIGKYPAMSLADARAKRAELREAKDRGLDPKAVLAGAIVPNRTVTFRQDMDTFVAHMRGQWVPAHLKDLAAVHGADCRSADGQANGQSDAGRRAERHQTRLGDHQRDRPAGAWAHRADDRARHGGRSRPVQRRPTPATTSCGSCRACRCRCEPRPAMPWRDLPGFFAELRQRPETAARALELLLLACCPRTGEVIPATWGEIDGNRWNVPAAHMKSGVARTIPLSAAAIALLDSIRPVQITPDTLIFGSRRRGGSGRQTDDAMQTLIREKMGLGYTVHGFRSSFMDWVAEVHPQRLLEAERALDHQIGNQVQRAYLRTDFFEQRRELAELWADHLHRGPCAS